MKLREKSSQKINSLGSLEKLFFEQGQAEASEALAKVFSPEDSNYYVHLRPGQGRNVARTDATGIETVDYLSFDPPSFWENAYQLMLVNVKKDKPDPFLYHDGEEFVIPVQGPGIHYDFFWADNEKVPRVYPKAPVLVKKGQAIRVQPQIPHRAWGAFDDATKAWMITRPLANAAAQIYFTPLNNEHNQPNSRQATKADLEKPGHYALRAWGISEKIRLQRQQSNLRVAQVAEACEIDAAHLSKIEGGTTNVTLETLLKICRVLDIDVAELIAPPAEAYNIGNLIIKEKSKKDASRPLFKAPLPEKHLAREPIKRRYLNHFLHPTVWQLSKNKLFVVNGDTSDYEWVLNNKNQSNYSWPSTWIMLNGRAVMDISFNNRRAGEVMEDESVIHLRGGGPKPSSILPLEDSLLLQIILSPEICYCAPNSNQ